MRLRLTPVQSSEGASSGESPAASFRVDYAPDAFPPAGPGAALVSLFPQVRFQSLGRAWSGGFGGADAVIVSVDAAVPSDVERLSMALSQAERPDGVIVFLDNPTVETTRKLIRAGAADVLPAPITEPSFAASLERVLLRREVEPTGPSHDSLVVGVLKAGGGVGATVLVTQLAAVLADRGQRVCVVDFDVQFGCAAMYLDMQDALTLDDVLAAGQGLSEVSFATELAAHISGARVLAAPRQFMTLDAVSPEAVQALLAALRREFDVILMDMPSAWTAWSNRALSLADRIAVVSHLSVPHAHLMRRQLHTLSLQSLDQTPPLLICNRVGGDAPSGVSLKSVERAVGRSFDVVVPDDPKMIGEAINQGVALRTLKRGTKVERALSELAQMLVPQQAATATRTSRWGR
ncbi:MAG: AAA family ATPase [Phenylobacterium sp.]|uniref:AAA family ATPase n=1 Tax=Phenylobacterium sp. TaxID=1871053 RepID=UPI00273423CE|nr:AAA family ATPase [Phenylobacterium sp.]MDP3173183.1 AAA family ATPase [Phenylobacterium sp.]